MTPSSIKAKGRLFQQQVAEMIKAKFFLSDRDVKSLSTGANGPDILLSELAYQFFPFDTECKKQEKIKIWEAFEQAKSHGDNPLLVFSRNRSDVLCCLKFEDLLKILVDRHRHFEQIEAAQARPPTRPQDSA